MIGSDRCSVRGRACGNIQSEATLEQPNGTGMNCKSRRLQQALSRNQGDVEISWCKTHITSDNFHQLDMTPKILVGNAVADALAKKGASVFLAANDWKKMDQITWAVAQAAPRSVSAHPENLGKMLPRTHWFLLAKGISLTRVRIFYTIPWCVGLAPQHHLLRTAQLSSLRSRARRAPDSTEVSTGAPYADKLLSMLLARSPELSGWSMNALAT